MAVERRLIRRRAIPAHRLPATLNPVLQRVYAARGLIEPQEIGLDLAQMLPPDQLLGLPLAVQILADAIRLRRKIVIAGDYDADGATGVALAVLGLRALGAESVAYVVPHRVTMGYGLSPALAQTAHAMNAQVLVTVDNGIASIAGVAAARELGMQVVVTDHHLPGPVLPQADALVNPNQPGCPFASKALAGVGVMFYLLVALRAHLREGGAFDLQPAPRLADWLDLVALGTVADVARLDRNNRILVSQGLARLRSGRARPGLLAMLSGAGRAVDTISALDLGFVLGPRINAAGRLADARIGIECLLADDAVRAAELAAALEQINRERREIQQGMTDTAIAIAERQQLEDRNGVCVFDEDWHEGVLGPVAARIKERLHRPTIAFAPSQDRELLKGSARSVPGLNIRDAIAAVDAAHPGLIERFGGHAMAAGLSLSKRAYPVFREAFNAACAAAMLPLEREARLDSDGPLSATELQIETARCLEQGGPWGAGFGEPRFDNRFEVIDARIVGGDGTHAKYRLRLAGGSGADISAIHFGGADRLCRRGQLHALYALGINRYRDRESIDLRIDYLEAITA
ncbi:MAG: recJ [Hydrocarboniphaga sp.]|uniref:single-stranded-DNA-specific exonuclease RecJ n=1 Tax=Hydrocarboniphaga sp. TaxID=2033016 RepID=UPI0026177476|nr:single-stranded-DNA-specific exonuclease RecJ [Hydrocarboniphaga sp.]MDB5971822.1 recJ [Hydrocarboniphaga sp.]